MDGREDKRIAVQSTTKPEEYLSRFSLSFDMLLAGYSTKDDGTIVITRGDRVIASNEDSLVGANVDAIAVLRRIKESIGSGTLLHTVRWKTDRRKVRFLSMTDMPSVCGESPQGA